MVDFSKLNDAAKAKRLRALGADYAEEDPDYAETLAIENAKKEEAKVELIAALYKGLTRDQRRALTKLIAWVDSPEDRYFILKGFAGTGKSYLLERFRRYVKDIQGRPFVSSAPTNKATKVIRALADPEAKTIYSILKMSMVEDEDSHVLTGAAGNLGLAIGTVIAIDESSMVNIAVDNAVDAAANAYELKILYLGDPAQLRPVGEISSPAWRRTDNPEHRAVLKEVKRFEGQLEGLSVRIREELKAVVRDPDRPRISLGELLFDDNDGEGSDSGVFVLSRAEFHRKLKYVSTGPGVFQNIKVGAWRNREVSNYNAEVRKNLGFVNEYEIGECISIASPITQMVGGRRVIVATIDDEFQVAHLEPGTYSPPDMQTIEYYEMRLDSGLKLWVPTGEDTALHDNLQKLALRAKREKGNDRKKRWAEYWELRNMFHNIRYGYGLTVHRLQGSTIGTVLIDAVDIMSNPDREERLQCLYVACTRPTTSLYTFI